MYRRNKPTVIHEAFNKYMKINDDPSSEHMRDCGCLHVRVQHAKKISLFWCSNEKRVRWWNCRPQDFILRSSCSSSTDHRSSSRDQDQDLELQANPNDRAPRHQIQPPWHAARGTFLIYRRVTPSVHEADLLQLPLPPKTQFEKHVYLFFLELNWKDGLR